VRLLLCDIQCVHACIYYKCYKRFANTSIHNSCVAMALMMRRWVMLSLLFICSRQSGTIKNVVQKSVSSCLIWGSSQLTGIDHSSAASSPLVLGIIDTQASLLHILFLPPHPKTFSVYLYPYFLELFLPLSLIEDKEIIQILQ